MFHSVFIGMLNISGKIFADALTGRRLDGSLPVNEIMLARDSLRPCAYSLLLANRIGVRLSDVANVTSLDSSLPSSAQQLLHRRHRQQ